MRQGSAAPVSTIWTSLIPGISVQRALQRVRGSRTPTHVNSARFSLREISLPLGRRNLFGHTTGSDAPRTSKLAVFLAIELLEGDGLIFAIMGFLPSIQGDDQNLPFLMLWAAGRDYSHCLDPRCRCAVLFSGSQNQLLDGACLRRADTSSQTTSAPGGSGCEQFGGGRAPSRRKPRGFAGAQPRGHDITSPSQFRRPASHRQGGAAA